MKYKVIKKNCLKHSVGDIIDLTEKQAKHLVNKVEPVKEVVKPKSKKASK